MNRLNVFNTVVLMHQLDIYACAFVNEMIQGQGGLPVPQERLNEIARQIHKLRWFFENEYGWSECIEACTGAISEFSPPLDSSAAHAYLKSLKRVILAAFEKRQFLQVKSDRVDFM